MRSGRIAALVALLLVAGCGGDSGGGQLSAEELRRQADAICAKYDERFQALGEPSSPEELETFLAEGIPLFEQQTAELEELNPPDELEDDWNRAMEVQHEGIATIRELRDAVGEGDADRIQELSAEAESSSAESNQLARDLGLETCGDET